MPGVNVFRGPDSEDLWMGGAAGLGDLNQDGFADIAVGLPNVYRHFLWKQNSQVRLFHGAPDFPRWLDLSIFPPVGAAATFHALNIADAFGDSLALAGDLNGDGLGDLLVGAPRADVNGVTSSGEAYLLYSRRDLAGEVRLEEGFDGIRMLGERYQDMLGSMVAPAGDFNGDGAPDMVVVAPPWNFDESTGRVYLVYGEGTGPGPLRLYRVEPDHGPKRGGTEVTLRGSGFEGTPRVLFGGADASGVTLVSRSELRVVAPPALATGFVEVRVEVGAGTVALASGFEYTPDFPRYDLSALGEWGFVIQGDPPGTGRSLPQSKSQVSFGDLDGDGAEEMLVATSVLGQWQVMVVHGGQDLPPELSAFDPSPHMSVARRAGAGLHASVAVVGDVDGDGLADAAIGERGGVGFLLFGRRQLQAEILLEEEVLAGVAVRFERSLFSPEDAHPLAFAPLGDITGDGIDDLATRFGRVSGEMLIIAGRSDWPDGVDLDSDFEPVQARIHVEFLPLDLQAAGDVNGDDLQDLLLQGPTSRGLSFLIHGGPELVGAIDAAMFIAQGGGSRIRAVLEGFPVSHVAGVGDATGDGYADLLIGDEGSGDLVNQGVAYLVRGGPDLPVEVELVARPAAPDGIVRIFGDGGMKQAGRVGPSGDFNADGLNDLLIASPGSGNVFLVLGGRSLPERIDLRRIGGQGIELEGRNGLGGLGAFVGPAGDLNGDGQPDFVLSEHHGLNGEPARLYVIYGPFGGRTFARGDANRDGALDVADPLGILGYLFLGAGPPLCEDALDCDDRGSVEIADAIYLLNFLFVGGPAPLPPHPQPGRDPTPDSLGCLGF